MHAQRAWILECDAGGVTETRIIHAETRNLHGLVEPLPSCGKWEGMFEQDAKAI